MVHKHNGNYTNDKPIQGKYDRCHCDILKHWDAFQEAFLKEL